jgi:hypothetical protein
MSRRRDKPLDIFKRLQVVRSIDDLIYDEDAGTFEKSKAMKYILNSCGISLFVL